MNSSLIDGEIRSPSWGREAAECGEEYGGLKAGPSQGDPDTGSRSLKSKGQNEVIAQQGRCLPCIQLTGVQIKASHMVHAPSSLSGVISEHKAE